MNDHPFSDCGCCGDSPQREPVGNPPGLPAIAYRLGTHGQFKARMLAQISPEPRLASLTTRADDDPAIALLDGWACVLDVLSFYQERIANEGYLRTATERRSLLELARAIGYELGPGVAAGTWASFTLETVESAPREARLVTGSRAQSTPGQDQVPQTFETTEELTARGEWNALKARQRRFVAPITGTTVAFRGTDTRLKAGDVLLWVGPDREADPTSTSWALRRVGAVETLFRDDPASAFTRVTLDAALSGWAAGTAPQVYALRQRAALFGHNAPDFKVMPGTVKRASGNRTRTEWKGFSLTGVHGGTLGNQIYLDTVQPKIVAGSWVVLSKPGAASLHRVTEVVEDSRAMFALAGKTGRLELQGPALTPFNTALRSTVVFAESELLELSEEPLTDAVVGQEVALETIVTPLPAKRRLLVSGLRVYVEVKSAGVVLHSGGTALPLPVGQRLRWVAGPVGADRQQHWTLLSPTHQTATVAAPAGALVRVVEINPATELAEVETSAPGVDGRLVITLKDPLAHSYVRDSVILSANVVPVTHGETKSEVLGSGDAGQAFQRFELKQKPLTYVAGSNAAGAASTVQVRVNDVLWEEVPTLFGRGPGDRCYVLRRADDGRVTVQFGDGVTGSRLPSGVESVRATYRVGIGMAGHLDAGQLNLLMSRPLGVKAVVNPLPAEGADDPETRDDARQNAPLTALTLGRIVSVRDFEDFASAFAGVGKAQAGWIWSGRQRIVFLTVAGAAGASLDPSSPTLQRLCSAMDAAREPHLPVRVGVSVPVTFRVVARVRILPDHPADTVLPAVRMALQETFAFARRAFGQPVHVSEVLAAMQGVRGVEAVNLESLHVGTTPSLPPRGRIAAQAARFDAVRGTILPAELLTLAAGGVGLTEVKS